MSESPELRLEPTAALASMQAIDSLAYDLEQATRTLRNALEAAQDGDPHGYLSAGLEAGFRAANMGDSVQAQLHELVRDAIATIRLLADHDALAAPAGVLTAPEPTSAAQERDQWVSPDVHGVCTIDPTLVEAIRERAQARTIKLETYAAPLDDANTLEATAQDELDFIATVIDQSSLADTDRAEYNLYAWLHMWKARDLRATTLQTAVEDFEYDLRRAESAYQVALLTHQPADEITNLELTISELRATLDGDPAAAVRVQELLAARESLLLNQGRGDALSFLTDVLPGGWQSNRFTREVSTLTLNEIDQELEILTEQVGLRTRRDWAVADLSATTALLDTAQQRLVDATAVYDAWIPQQIPMQRTYLTALKAKIADRYPPGTPAYNALIELEAVLDTRDTALFTARYTAFTDLMAADTNLSMIVGYEFYQNGAFNDPRLHVETGRIRFAEVMEQSPFKTIAKDLFLNTLLLGIPSLVRNSSVLNHEGISANVRGQHQVGLAMDIVGMAATMPWGRALKMVFMEHNVLRLTDEGMALLRARGKSEVQIAMINEKLVYVDADALSHVLNPLNDAEMVTYLDDLGMSPTFPPPTSDSIRKEALKQWTEKMGRSPTESELQMLDKLIAENTTMVPRYTPKGVRMPGITYAEGENILAQYPDSYQTVIVEAMEENSVVALRTRPEGAYGYDTQVPPKDAGVTKPMVLYNYPDGRRIIVRDGVLETRLSDIDVADYKVDDIWVLDETFVGSGGFAERVNLALAGDPIQHGPLVRGLTMDDVLHKLGQYDPTTGTYGNRQLIIDFFNKEKVLVFQKNATFTGYVDEMPLMEYLREHNPAGRAALKQALPADIWRDINK